MRFLLIVVMIALLPLRGWVGDAMAMEMAVQQTRIVQLASAEPMAADCLMNLQTGVSPSADASTVPSDAREAGSPCNCNACDLCLAMASLTFSRTTQATFIRHAQPLTSGTRFSSAERGITLKPPIS